MKKSTFFLFIALGMLLIPTYVVNAADTDFELSENDIEWCDEQFALYETLGLEWFLENNHYSIESRVCASLYEDPLWAYEGPDRIQKLLERSEFYLKLELQESKEEAQKGISDPNPATIPSWIKDVAKFWIDDQIDDAGFVQVIEWLVQNDIIQIPYAKAPESEAAIEVPIWIKTSAEFWVAGQTSDDEFATALEWLINNGIIRV